MGTRKKGKVHIGLYVDEPVRNRLDELARIWGFSNRSQVILRLLKFGVSELDQLTRNSGPRPSKAEAA